MSHAARNWGDLKTRVITALGLVLVGGGAFVLGGTVLRLVVAAVCAVMIWELVRILAPAQRVAGIALAGGASVAILGPVAGVAVWVLALALIIVGAIWLKTGRVTFALYGALILAGCFSLYSLRLLDWRIAAWIVTIVVVSDIAGYVFGRLLGGPKFWPRISPKKTWSGTIGGWIGAAIVGFIFAGSIGSMVVLSSVLIAFAAQMGDIAESAIKRRAGVKDASDILPGHGGFMDRFDAMIAAFAVALLFVPEVLQLTIAG